MFLVQNWNQIAIFLVVQAHSSITLRDYEYWVFSRELSFNDQFMLQKLFIFIDQKLKLVLKFE